MDRIKGQIEAQIQEIVFFGSLIASFSFFLSGVLHLTLSPESLGFILGSFGAATVSALFSVFGYGYFYLAVIALHMGYVTNYHVFNFKDLKREYPVLLYSLFAHFLIITLFSTLLTVFQVYMEIPAGGSLARGAGGFMGSIFGGHLYMAMGVYGSLLLLAVFQIVTAIVAGFFELQDVLLALKSTSKTTAHLSIKGAKHMNNALLNGAQFILKGNEFSEATAASAGRMMARSMNKANHIFTEHFHIYREEEPVVEAKIEKNDRKETVRPAVKKAASAMALRSEKLMASLKELKKMTAMKKPVGVTKTPAQVKPSAPVKTATTAVKAASKVTEKVSEKPVEKKAAKKKTTTVVKAKAKKKL